MNRAPAVIVGVCVALLLSLRADAQLPTLVLQGGTLIDGNGGSPINDAVVVIDGHESGQSASRARCRTRNPRG